MAKRGKENRGDPSVLRYVVNFLRFHSGVKRGKRMTQAEFGRACRMDQSEISRMELGKLAPSEDQLRRMVKVAQVEWSVVVHIREFYALLIPAVGRAAQASDRMPSLKSFEPLLLAILPFFMDTDSEPPRPSPDEERREADQIWTVLEHHPIPYRRRLIEVSPDSGSWALALRVCEASLKSAAHKPEEALELAELAVSIADGVTGEESWHSRLLGYCWAHVANARRVANDLDGADRAFAQAWNLWREGVKSDPTVLDEWLLPAMEASLRRAQRRFAEALELLGRARTRQGGASPAASLAILLNESNVYSLGGEPQRSLAALSKAAQLCEESGDRRMLLALRFNIADDLCRLERLEEAQKLLPEVRKLALEQANELDLIRVGWLTARVAAGKGRTAEAIAGLERVREDFRVHKQPYNAALSSLDLAVLWLKEGRTGEVKDLAIAMAWIFTAQGITREALAALSLFCKAAMQENATVELARKTIADIEQARRSASSA